MKGVDTIFSVFVHVVVSTVLHVSMLTASPTYSLHCVLLCGTSFLLSSFLLDLLSSAWVFRS